jgi:hypothetical protein
MRKNPRRILSPQRLPFRHPGIVQKSQHLAQRRLAAKAFGATGVLIA